MISHRSVSGGRAQANAPTGGGMPRYATDLVEELVATVRRGSRWRDALHAAMSRAGGPGDNGTDESCANWIWLAELAGREMAVVLNGGLGYLAAGLAPHFARVCYQDPRDPLAKFARLRFAQDGLRNISATRARVDELPYRATSVDCIALQDLPAEYSLRDLAGLACHCFRILRSGGCLYLGWHNPHYYRRLLGVGRSRTDHDVASRVGSARRVTRMLSEIGFRAVARYYASPSHRRLQNIVPAARHAVVAYENWERMGAPSSRLRALATRLGLWPCLYSSQLVLAYR